MLMLLDRRLLYHSNLLLDAADSLLDESNLLGDILSLRRVRSVIRLLRRGGCLVGLGAMSDPMELFWRDHLCLNEVTLLAATVVFKEVLS